MKKICFTILVIFFTLILPASGFGGIIRSSIVCHHRVEDPGRIGMEIEIINKGDETAYNTIVTVFLADWVQKSENLGNNRPGGKIRFSSQYLNSEMMPGKYTGVIRVSFEEQSGIPHRAFHFIEIPYHPDQIRHDDPGLTLHLESPFFNTKAFWGSKGKIRLSMKNGHKKTIKPYIVFYLPNGFITPESERLYELSPAEERVDIIPLARDSLVREESTYTVVSWYEQNGVHLSQRVEGKIRIEERPIYFRWYIVSGVISLAIIFGVIYYRGRGRRGE